MFRLAVIAISLLLASSSVSFAAENASPQRSKDLYFSEALYYAFQEEWFEAISRLDTELALSKELDEPELDTLYSYLDQAEFDIGDFELYYRMHHRAGRAIQAVIEGNVDEKVRNEAIFRLARIFFQKEQPGNAFHALERISGEVPENIIDDLAFLRTQVLMANGRFEEAVNILKQLEGVKSLEGFTSYNLGIALLNEGKTKEGRQYLDRTGLLQSDNPVTLAIKDKSNLVLGDKMLNEKDFTGAKEVLDRVRLEGPFSNRALLGSGWADASQENYEKALVPWTILADRELTDPSVQEALVAVPYAYGKLNVYSKSALLYGKALNSFGQEIDKLSDSIKSIREGTFLNALARGEFKQDANWVVKLRNLPESPETYYLLDLMASHDFQESLKNYLDLEQLRRKLKTWTKDLAAYSDIIEKRRSYYEPLIPGIDAQFRKLDSQMRLRLEQKDHIEQRLQSMLVAPRPDYLATAEERIIGQRIERLFQSANPLGKEASGSITARIKRLRGVLDWTIYTEYDQRLTDAYKNLHKLNVVVEMLRRQYTDFVRTRQAATQSYQGYDDIIRRQQIRIATATEKTEKLMAQQGHMIETMAVNELSKRRERLEEFQVKARFAMADSYDRATRAQARKEAGQ